MCPITINFTYLSQNFNIPNITFAAVMIYWYCLLYVYQ